MKDYIDIDEIFEEIEIKEIALKDIKTLPNEFYPRICIDHETVDIYSNYMKNKKDDKFPPIVINHEYYLIDGAHRIEAYKKNDKKIIKAKIIQTKTQDDIIMLSIKYNLSHGKSFTIKDYQKIQNILKTQRIVEKISNNEIDNKINIDMFNEIFKNINIIMQSFIDDVKKYNYYNQDNIDNIEINNTNSNDNNDIEKNFEDLEIEESDMFDIKNFIKQNKQLNKQPKYYNNNIKKSDNNNYVSITDLNEKNENFENFANNENINNIPDNISNYISDDNQQLHPKIINLITDGIIDPEIGNKIKMEIKKENQEIIINILEKYIEQCSKTHWNEILKINKKNYYNPIQFQYLISEFKNKNFKIYDLNNYIIDMNTIIDKIINTELSQINKLKSVILSTALMLSTIRDYFVKNGNQIDMQKYLPIYEKEKFIELINNGILPFFCSSSSINEEDKNFIKVTIKNII